MTLPTVNLPIHQLDHPVVAHAQRVPQIDAAGGAARILALVDRVWLKVKTGRHRGGVTTVSPREAVDLTGPVHAPEWLEGWWLGFVGLRKEDSATDVYAVALQRSTVLPRPGHLIYSTALDTSAHPHQCTAGSHQRPRR